MQAEFLHSLARLTLAAHSKKGTRLPDVLKIPRPYDQLPSRGRKRRATAGEAVQKLSKIFGGPVSG